MRAALKTATRDERAWTLRRALTLVRDPGLVARVLEIALTDEWEPTRAAWIARQVGSGSGVAELAHAFVEKHLAVLAAKAQEDGRVWLLPDAAGAFNEPRRADALLATQRRLLGEPGRDAAKQAAAGIRLRSGIRQREGGRLAGELATRGQVPVAPPGAP